MYQHVEFFLQVGTPLCTWTEVPGCSVLPWQPSPVPWSQVGTSWDFRLILPPPCWKSTDLFSLIETVLAGAAIMKKMDSRVLVVMLSEGGGSVWVKTLEPSASTMA